MKKTNFLTAAFLLAVVITSSDAMANARCGVGTMLFGGSNGIISQTWENSTNRAFSGGSSISSGTSGCKHNGNFLSFEERTHDQQLLYVNANYEELMLEMADGRGEVLEAFAQTLGCDRGLMPEFTRMARSRYGQIFSDEKTSPEQMLLNVKQQIKANPRLESGCKAYVI